MVDGCGEFVSARYCAFDDIETDLTGDLCSVYVIHSGGDSFGHDEAAYFDFVWVFGKLDLAQAAVKIIKYHADRYRKRHQRGGVFTLTAPSRQRRLLSRMS